MAVSNLKSPDDWTRTTFDGRPTGCYFCGEEITDVAVVWNGHSPDLESLGLVAFHPDCAIGLSVELIVDARNAQRLLAGKPLTAGISRSLLPQGEA